MKKERFSSVCSRRSFCLQGAGILFLLTMANQVGCSTLKGKKKSKDDVSDFEEDEDSDSDEEESVFDSERKKQNELSDFVAQNGRKSKSKKSTVRPGDDFLLSDKAKEIYANTER